MISNPKLVDVNGAQPQMQWALVWQGGALLICFFLIFGSTLGPLYSDWRTFDTFSHGLLVPFIAAYMAWQKRALVKKLEVVPSASAVMLLIPAALLALAGKVIGDAFSERVALVLYLGGAVWSLFGWRMLKLLSFPLAYLFLMIPLPYAAVKEVAYQLRIVNAALAAPALRALGVPVYRDSYYLHLPDITLEVADLCSGISSVFALLALGAAYVYFSPLSPRWKLVAVASTFPFAALINLVRIILTAALAYHVTPAVLGVLIHEMTGTITFFIALCLFITLCEFLLRRFKKPAGAGVQAAEASDTAAESGAALPEARKSWGAAAVAFAVLIPTVFLAFKIDAQVPVPLARDLGELPGKIGEFHVAEEQKDGSYRDPDAESELSRKYVGPQDESVELYVGFRGRQISAKRLRSPKLQFPYGWNFVWIEPVRLSAGGGAPIHAQWMLTQNNQIQALVLYWYQRSGETFGGEVQNRLWQARDAIIHRRSDGAVIRLATRTEPEKLEQAKNRLEAFATALYPELHRLLPQ